MTECQNTIDVKRVYPLKIKCFGFFCLEKYCRRWTSRRIGSCTTLGISISTEQKTEALPTGATWRLSTRRCPDAAFLIGETDFKKTTAEILEIYRRRDAVEKCFDHLKNDIDMRRLYVQSDEVAQGKMFVAFIALIVRSYMQNRLSEYMNSHKYTFQKILLELDKVKLIHSANHKNNFRLLNPSTKMQREIIEQLGLTPDAFGFV